MKYMLFLFGFGFLSFACQAEASKTPKSGRSPASESLKLICADSDTSARPWFNFLLDVKGKTADMGFLDYPCMTCEVMVKPAWPELSKGGTVVPGKRGEVNVEWADGDGGVVALKKKGEGYAGTIRFPEGRSEVKIKEDSEFDVGCRKVDSFR